MNNLLKKRVAVLGLAGAMILASLTGCSSNTAQSDQSTQTETVSETAGSTDESQETTLVKTENDPVDPEAVALKVGDTEVKAAELFYYYYGMKQQLEQTYAMYGTQLDYSTAFQQDMTIGDYLKYMVELQVLNMVYLKEQSSEYSAELTDDEIETVENGVTSFMANVSAEDRAFYGFNEENVKATLEHSILGSKVLEQIIDKNTAELTDEEKESCVYRTVQHILFLYEDEDQTAASGETVSEADVQSYKDSQKAKAEEILERAQNGEDFQTLADEYNEDNGFEYSFNKDGQTIDGTSFVSEFVRVGNSLKEGEMAIAETEYGYHVMKCVSENNEELYTEALRNAALEKINTVYSEWLDTNQPEFYDVWQNFVVQNPVASEEAGVEETDASTAESSAADTSEAETSDDSAASEETQSSSSDGQ